MAKDCSRCYRKIFGYFINLSYKIRSLTQNPNTFCRLKKPYNCVLRAVQILEAIERVEKLFERPDS